MSTYLPFAQAAAFLREFAHVSVSEASAQRVSYAAGAAVIVEQTRVADQVVAYQLPPRAGAECVLLSADGAMVPVVGGEWREVKTLVVGVVEAHEHADGPPVVHTTQLSSFSRVSGAETFTHLATAETYQRGVERAQTVVAVSDGAEWIQHFFDVQCPQATRILDFPHAAQRLSHIAQTVWGQGSDAARHWQNEHIHALKHDGPTGVLAAVRTLVSEHNDNVTLLEDHAYLEKRAAQMDYPTYQANGWPIASGCVESANKLVVEARLKGAGMHWALKHVNPMVALRNVVCSERWQETWPLVVARRRRQARERARKRGSKQSAVTSLPQHPVTPVSVPRGKAHKPKANHPWKQPTLAGGMRHNAAQAAAARD